MGTELTGKTVVCGLGEIGLPLFHVARGALGDEVVGVDIDPVDVDGPVGVLHVAYPFEIAEFEGVTASYIGRYKPQVTVIHSTVAPGTTRRVFEKAGAPVVHSPVRGKHFKMRRDLMYYTKFVGGVEAAGPSLAKEHLESLSFGVEVLASAEATELAKLIETTMFGYLIAWAQEVERYCDTLGVQYEEAMALTDQVPFFPPVQFFPGIIGGHCVMPNMELLKNIVGETDLLRAVVASNEAKKQRDGGGEEDRSAASRGAELAKKAFSVRRGDYK